MEKEVLLKIQGLQIAPEEQSDAIEVITTGEYYFRNGQHFIIYDEILEGDVQVTKNTIKVKENYMELTKKGAVNVHMVFEKNRQNFTYYYTPYGSLQIGVDASEVSVTEDEKGLLIRVLYGLEINHEHMANCRIQIVATPKGSEAFEI